MLRYGNRPNRHPLRLRHRHWNLRRALELARLSLCNCRHAIGRDRAAPESRDAAAACSSTAPGDRGVTADIARYLDGERVDFSAVQSSLCARPVPTQTLRDDARAPLGHAQTYGALRTRSGSRQWEGARGRRRSDGTKSGAGRHSVPPRPCGRPKAWRLSAPAERAQGQALALEGVHFDGGTRACRDCKALAVRTGDGRRQRKSKRQGSGRGAICASGRGRISPASQCVAQPPPFWSPAPRQAPSAAVDS